MASTTRQSTSAARRAARRGLAAALALLALFGCGQGGTTAREGERELVVHAASSLREAFTAIAGGFEGARPGVEVAFTFGGSQDLRRQLAEGASADVFASADERQMALLQELGGVEDPRVFAHNALVVVVARDRAAVVRSLAELPRAERIVLGAPDVPVGRYSLAVLDAASRTLGAGFRAAVEARVVSRELNVRQVLAKVTLGEAEAAIVYRSDARVAGEAVSVVELPPELGVAARYPVAILKAAPHPDLARAFVEHLSSPEARRELERAGFAAPDEARP